MEHAAPQLKYLPPVWALLWQRLAALCLPELDHSERLALHRWVAQWDGQTQDLAEIQGITQGLFLSNEFLFAENPQDEQDWRCVLSGLLAAALTADTAPIPGAALVQRLVLSSPLFAQQTAASWQSHFIALDNAFLSPMPDHLRTAVAQRHLQLSALLLRLPLLENLPNLPNIDRFIFALHEWPLNRQLWEWGCLIQYVEKAHFTPNGQANFLASSAGWQRSHESTLKKCAELYQLACLYRPNVELANLSAAAQEEWSIALRMAALLRIHPQPQQALRQWLFETIGQLEAENLEDAEAMAQAWLAQLRAQEGNSPLVALADELAQAWTAATLAHRLAYQHTTLAEQALQHNALTTAPLHLSAAQTTLCTRDLGFVLHYLGLHIGYIEQARAPAPWFWQHVGCFLPMPVRAEVQTFLPQLDSGWHLNPTQLALFKTTQEALCEVFTWPEWTQIGPFRNQLTAAGLATSEFQALQDNERLARTFTALPCQGMVAQSIFCHAVPLPALMTGIAGKTLWPSQPPASQGVASQYVDLPLYIRVVPK